MTSSKNREERDITSLEVGEFFISMDSLTKVSIRFDRVLIPTILNSHQSVELSPFVLKAIWLLLSRDDRKAILGDLKEDYPEVYREHGAAFARRWLLTEVISAIAMRNKLVRWLAVGGVVKWVTDWFSRLVG